MDKPTSPDRLSDLSVDIIRNILSFLPTKNAARTSILSSQWRYTWNSIPNLAFEDSDNLHTNIENLSGFITQAFLLHEGPIHEFKLRQKHPIRAQYMDHWLVFLSRNDIRVLVLEVPQFRRVHSSLYSCHNLTHLELSCYAIAPPPPSFKLKGFMFLKSLCLSKIQTCPTAIETIVAHSPLLEELKLQGCDSISKLTVCAPNLKYLHIATVSRPLSLFIPRLEELKLDFKNTWKFSIGDESFQGSSEFRHLRTIELSNVSFEDAGVTTAISCLIKGAYNLQTIEISVSKLVTPAILDDASYWNMDCAPPGFTYDNLKVIKMKGPRGGTEEMNFVEFLLARSPVLEKLILESSMYVADKVVTRLMTKFLSFPRASTTAEILMGDRPKPW